MPRPLVFGNGSMLVGIDERYVIRDLYWPQVGLPNHLSGHPIRMGVWANGRFAWSDEWEQELRYRPGTMVGDVKLRHRGLGLELQISEGVAPQDPYYVRQIEVRNMTPIKQDVRIFFSHDLRIAASDIGDTAFYNPYVDGIVHYKNKYAFLFGGSTATGGLYEYVTGIKDFGGLEGTWRDAEDGHLGQNPISQGSVDSTFSLRAELEPNGRADALYWMVCGDSLHSVVAGYRDLVRTGFRETISATCRFWRAWADREVEGLDTLPKECQDLFRQSLLIIRTQIDNGGAVIAANDTDIMKTNRATYSYMWPRDGALVSMVMDRVGFHQLGRRFFEFCRNVLPLDRPVLMHKYGPDGSLGASWHPWMNEGRPEVPFQEDETALTLVALWEHYRHHKDLEFLREMFDGFVVPTADFIIKYRDPSTKLPMPSWDLWEERRGIHAFTVASVWAALAACSHMAKALGDERELLYRNAAQEVHEALLTHLVDPANETFYRCLVTDAEGDLTPDTRVDASVLGVVLLGAVAPHDPRAVATIDLVESKLTVKTPIGGVARYEQDYYFRREGNYPGNPWIICSLWLAQCRMLQANEVEELSDAVDWMHWACRRAATTGVLAEQHDPFTGEPLSVSPLTWSHAEYVQTVLEYLRRHQELSARVAVRS